MAGSKTAHDYFYAKKAVHGHHRFCMLCWPDESAIPGSLVDHQKPGKSLVGCCLNHCSPGNMQRHLRRMHAIETVVFKEDKCDTKCDEQGPNKIDHAVTKDFVYSFVLK